MSPADDTPLGRWCQSAQTVIRTILRACRHDRNYTRASSLWASALGDLQRRYADGDVLPYYKQYFQIDALNNPPDLVDDGTIRSELYIQPTRALRVWRLTSLVDVATGVVTDSWEITA